MTKNPDKNWSLLICLTLTLTLTLLVVFYQVHSFGFVNIDDPIYVSENPNIQAGITINAVKWAFTTGYFGNWNPLTWLSYMLDWQLFGSNPAGFHLTNLIFHILNTLLLFFVLKQMTKAVWQSAFVAALFALHPLHVEAVAWVSGRKDILSTFFWLLTMWAYLRYVKQPNVFRYLLVLLLFVMGIMAKPMLITLPFVFLLLDYWPLDRIKRVDWKTISQLILEKIPFMALAVVFSVMAFFTQRSIGALPEFTEFSLKFRIYNALISYLGYIEKLFCPSHLAVFYPHPFENVSVLYAVISATVLLALTILVLRFAKNRKYLVTGWFWYLGTLVPVIGLVQIGSQAMADRYTYITLTGLFIIIAWSLPDLLGKWTYRKMVLWISSILVLIILTAFTYLQTRYWKDSITLFQHALAVTENNYVVHFSITQPLLDQGRIEEAIWHSSQAVRIKPNYADGINALGTALHRAGKIDEAIGCYKKALEIDPHLALAHFNLAVAFMTKGRFSEAVIECQKSLQIKPDEPDVLNVLGIALSQQGKFEEALKEYEKILLLQPRNAVAHNDFGIVLYRLGKLDDAVAQFRQAVQINSEYADAKNNLSAVLTEKQKTIDNASESNKK